MSNGDGFGRVVADIAGKTNRYDRIISLQDKVHLFRALRRTKRMGCSLERAQFYPAFSDERTRMRWLNRFRKEGVCAAAIVHPLARIRPGARIEDGTVIFPYADVGERSVVKTGCVLALKAAVGAHCVIGRGVSLARCAVIKDGNRIPDGMRIEEKTVIRKTALESFGKCLVKR